MSNWYDSEVKSLYKQFEKGEVPKKLTILSAGSPGLQSLEECRTLFDLFLLTT